MATSQLVCEDELRGNTIDGSPTERCESIDSVGKTQECDACFKSLFASSISPQLQHAASAYFKTPRVAGSLG
eukprot:6010806-Amphidinium_carterae.2